MHYRHNEHVKESYATLLMGTPKGLFNSTLHQPTPGTQTTSPRVSGHPPICAWSVQGSTPSPYSIKSEGLIPPKHHPQTAAGETKDRVWTEELAGVVYQIPCAGCPATYVGQTGRCLRKQMKEHRKAVESGDCANSALATWSHHYPVDWVNIRVLKQ